MRERWRWECSRRRKEGRRKEGKIRETKVREKTEHNKHEIERDGKRNEWKKRRKVRG